LKIPEKLILSYKHKTINAFCNKIKEFTIINKLEHNYKELCLQLWVGRDRKNINQSKSKEFVAFLPVDLKNFPILFDEKNIKLIKGSFLDELVQAERKYLEEDYNSFKQKNAEVLGNMTQTEFNEAYELFYSRTYQYVSADKEKITAFIPLVDLFNYKTEGKNKISWKYNTDSNMFMLYATEAISKGSEVRIFLIIAFYRIRQSL
jgi:hypothetical protein